MNYDQYKAGYDRDGFAIVRKFLDSAEFAELSSNLIV